MTTADPEGHGLSLLASEQNYQLARLMNQKNLFIPVVGDFAGPIAIRNIARYLKDRNGIVSAFYASNVEYYLNEEKKLRFWKNAATLPVLSPMRDLFKQIHSGRIPGIR
jgi:hypothetical protein